MQSGRFLSLDLRILCSCGRPWAYTSPKCAVTAVLREVSERIHPFSMQLGALAVCVIWLIKIHALSVEGAAVPSSTGTACSLRFSKLRQDCSRWKVRSAALAFVISSAVFMSD